MKILNDQIKDSLKNVVKIPCLKNIRSLQQLLIDGGYSKKIFGGRVNQKASIEAASDSDRGVTERLANAFDATLTAARISVGITESSRELTPRKSVQKFLNPNISLCEWNPQDKRIDFKKPLIEFWAEDESEKNIFRKHNPGDGLSNVLVCDFGTGISRENMPNTILNLNSESKLTEFEAIGQFGHGGSSALMFCESCLIVTMPRFIEQISDDFYWTIIFIEKAKEISKQSLVRYWFCDDDGLPLIGKIKDFEQLANFLPGTSIWHFGYNKSGWIGKISGPSQRNPYGRLGRLFFSYPLPFEVRGQFARGDKEDSTRTIKGAYYRLNESDDKTIEYKSSEQSEKLIVDGQEYGEFNFFYFVLREKESLNNYIDPSHPIILTLNGQNHGELTRTLFLNANLPELSSSIILEVRLENIEEEAKSEIISNSREIPKNSIFTKILQERLTKRLMDDDKLQELERLRQEAKVKQASLGLSDKMSKFLSSILSNAMGGASEIEGDDSPGKGGKKPPKPVNPIPPNDPPCILEFYNDECLYVPEGTTVLAKFKSDARPPRYSFHGDNPRCFCKINIDDKCKNILEIVGKGDISINGYGSVTISCKEDVRNPITEKLKIAELEITIQKTDGGILSRKKDIGVAPKPVEKEKQKRQNIKTEIVFYASSLNKIEEAKQFLGEENILPFQQSTNLQKFLELDLIPDDCSYWGAKCEGEDMSKIIIDINATNSKLLEILKTCKTGDVRLKAKEKYVQDIVLDCYQHWFQLKNYTDKINEKLFVNNDDEQKRAVEIYLNHDKITKLISEEFGLKY